MIIDYLGNFPELQLKSTNTEEKQEIWTDPFDGTNSRYYPYTLATFIVTIASKKVAEETLLAGLIERLNDWEDVSVENVHTERKTEANEYGSDGCYLEAKLVVKIN